MQRQRNIGEQLIRDLKTKGVPVDSLVVDITDRIVVLSGEAYSYYDLQLIQLHSRSLMSDYRVVMNISVMVGDAERQSDQVAANHHRNCIVSVESSSNLRSPYICSISFLSRVTCPPRELCSRIYLPVVRSVRIFPREAQQIRLLD